MLKEFKHVQAEAKLIAGCYDLTQLLTNIPDEILHNTLILISDSIVDDKDLYTRVVKQLHIDFLQAAIRYNIANAQLHNR